MAEPAATPDTASLRSEFLLDPAVTFLNDDDRRFTVVRAYLVPRRALRTGDLSMTMATVDGPFELMDLEAFVPKRFDAGELQGILEDQHALSAPREVQRRRQAVQPAADHDRVPAHGSSASAPAGSIAASSPSVSGLIGGRRR